jgi:hypothetical protein
MSFNSDVALSGFQQVDEAERSKKVDGWKFNVMIQIVLNGLCK